MGFRESCDNFFLGYGINPDFESVMSKSIKFMFVAMSLFFPFG